MPIAQDGKIYETEYDLEMGRPVPVEASGSTQTQGGTPVPPVENNAPQANVEAERGILDKLLGIGGERYQTWPEKAVRGAVEGAINAFALPGDVYSGKVQAGSPQEIERAMDLAGLMVFGPAPVASRMADGTLGSFAGVKSKLLPREKLQAAQKLESEGVNPDDIWQQTGFFKDKSDGRWKYEIGDQDAKINKDFLERKTSIGDATGKLHELYDHPELYKAYPHLKDVNVVIDPEMKSIGTFNPSTNTLKLNPTKIGSDQAMMDVISHEVQHKIQDFEGFAYGSTAAIAKRRTLDKINAELKDIRNNNKDFPDDPRFNELVSLHEEINSPYSSINSLSIARNPSGETFDNYLYTRTPGEVEANLVMARRLLSEQQRRNWSPQQMLDWLVETKSVNAVSGQKHRQPLGFLADE